ncbi:hypothetical protein [Flavimaricola marinus]|uniref:Uncharacterized protein n=1 Tax=Flavimaricola marinus TaxID=1819565 RepID=A0A238LFX2_9RHOB|nr:hypothetical protein [Flavimaricola marinus]SMY08579.1 hypothetical protein LOM8899_02733 [Flavimaricola marinus]
MRNIICISLMLATPAAAQPLFDPSCYARDYSPEHLASQPDQIVDEFLLQFSHDTKYDQTFAWISVELTDQGHVAGTPLAGQTLDQGLICWVDDVTAGCSVECDGGWFEVTRNDGNILELRTDYLLVGDTEGCGGAVDLSEGPGRTTTYRLMRVANAICDERIPR